MSQPQDQKKVRVTGIWVDPRTTIGGPTKTGTATVNQIVRKLTRDVVSKVNDEFSFTPPLNWEEMAVQCFPTAAKPEDKISVLADVGLITLVQPGPHAARVKNHFNKLKEEHQELEKQNLQLSEALADAQNAGNSPGAVKETGEERDSVKDIYGLLGAIEDLRMIVGQQQAELASQKDSLAKERSERKAEAASQKDALVKERSERKAEVAQLEKKAELQGAQLEEQAKKIEKQERALREEEKQRQQGINTITELTVKLIPLHLRVLLDLSREKVLKLMNVDSWNDLCSKHDVQQLTDMIVLALAQSNSKHRLPRDTVEFLCSFNNIRREGNRSAHTASELEIRTAVMSKQIESQDRRFLTQCFAFVYEREVDAEL